MKQSAFAFIGYRVMECHLKGHRAFRDSDSYTLDIRSSFVGVEEGLFPVPGKPWHCELTCALIFETPEDVPVELSLTAIGEFEFSDEMDEIDENLWKRVISSRAPALIYSQLRPVARSLMSDGGFPNFLLPLIQFEPSPPTKQDSQRDTD